MELFRQYLKQTILNHKEIDRMITDITMSIVNDMENLMLTIENINIINKRVADAVGEKLGDLIDPSLRLEVVVMITIKGDYRVMWSFMNKNNEPVGIERLIP